MNVFMLVHRLIRHNPTPAAHAFDFFACSFVSDAAEALRPNDYCNVAGLACTSMSFTLGPKIIDVELQVAHPKALTLDMARSQLKALRTMGCTNVGLVTPYIDLVHNNNVKVSCSRPCQVR